MSTLYQAVPNPMTASPSEEEIHPMALLLAEMDETMREPEIGEIRFGIIVEKSRSEILIDIGFKSEGIVSGRELDRLGDDMDDLEVGAEIPVFILREDRDGNMLLSITRAQAEKDWTRAEGLLESQDIFESTVSGYNRGGVIVRMGHVRGFVPASQLSNETQAKQDRNADPEDRWAPLVDEPLMMKVIDLDRRRNRLILSERLAMREWRREQKEKLLEALAEGDVKEGLVSSLADFGAFVDIGGADGLIHLSELSWSRVRHPNEVVEVGQKVKVQILSVDQDRRRIGLSLRRLQPRPWDTVDERYEVGQVIRGTITKLVNFGAFARLNDEPIEGLIHISELANHRVGHPNEVVKEGEEYDLRIIRIDADKRRIGLSLKQALPEEEDAQVDWMAVPLDENPDIAESAEAPVEAMQMEEASTTEESMEEPLVEESMVEEPLMEETPQEEAVAQAAD